MIKKKLKDIRDALNFQFKEEDVSKVCFILIIYKIRLIFID